MLARTRTHGLTKPQQPRVPNRDLALGRGVGDRTPLPALPCLSWGTGWGEGRAIEHTAQNKREGKKRGCGIVKRTKKAKKATGGRGTTEEEKNQVLPVSRLWPGQALD